MAVEAFMNSTYVAQKDDKHTIKLERSDYLIRTATRAIQGLTGTAISDDEKYKRKYARGTDDIQKLLKKLQPHINYTYDDKVTEYRSSP